MRNGIVYLNAIKNNRDKTPDRKTDLVAKSKAYAKAFFLDWFARPRVSKLGDSAGRKLTH